MTDRSLFDAGWRQGSILHAQLPVTVVLSSDGKPEAVQQEYSIWVVASQDCDLSSYLEGHDEALVELRPVFDSGTPQDFGIRSRKLRLTDQYHVHAESPRLHVSPSVLSSLNEARQDDVPDERVVAFKTWLGLRYDRPAVPPELVDLMKAIATAVSKNRSSVRGMIHDILVQVEPGDPPLYVVFAVITDDADQSEIRSWVVDALVNVPTELGVLERIDAGTRAETSLQLLEESYTADLSQITWGKASGPVGAL